MDQSPTYPWTTDVGGLQITFRLMTSADVGAMLELNRNLPEKDLLFLRTDLTQQEVVERWARRIERDEMVTILAEDQAQLVGYCSLQISDILWTRHLGEILLMVSSDYRGKGLGGRLARQIFNIAEDFELQKFVVQMMSTQRNAQSLFHHLGFIPEAMLHDWVIDRAGNTHDLIVMAREVEDSEF